MALYKGLGKTNPSDLTSYDNLTQWCKMKGFNPSDPI